MKLKLLFLLPALCVALQLGTQEAGECPHRALMESKQAPHVMDVGTGCTCIAYCALHGYGLPTVKAKHGPNFPPDPWGRK